MTKPMWLRYVPPVAAIQERVGVIRAYVIEAPELNNWELGRVELYYADDGKRQWRTLDHWKTDWRAGFGSREAAAQDLVTQSPRTVRLIADRRRRQNDNPA